MKKTVLTAIGVIGGVTAVVGTIFGLKKKRKHYIWKDIESWPKWLRLFSLYFKRKEIKIMLKEFSKKFSTSVCKIADKTPASVLVLSGSIVTLLLYAKGHTDAIKCVNKAAEDANLDLKLNY